MKKPKYAAVKTLLGGDPDINRREIIDTDDGSEILVMNQGAADNWSKASKRSN